MGLPAYSPELQSPAERLHYFHPFRIGAATLVIFGAYAGLIIWMGGHAAGTEARLALGVALLLATVGRTFQPRTLSADATEIRWKKLFQPAQTLPRHDVAAIQYVTTARPGAPRYYFVNRDGIAVLWVDRFTPPRMGSFASYLGIPMETASVAPPKSAGSDAAVRARAIAGSRRSGMVAMSICAAISLAGTIGAVFWVRHEGAVLTAYQRAPLCDQPSADPLVCRFDAPAVVTGVNTDRGRIEIRFLSAVPGFSHETTWVRILSGEVPDPGFGIGNSVQIEIFDGRTMAINGAKTDGFDTLRSNASWLLVPGAGFFLAFSLIGLAVSLKGPDSWFVSRSPAAAAPKLTPGNPPAVSPTGGLAHRLWVAWVG